MDQNYRFFTITQHMYSGADIITYPTKEILSKIAFFKKAWQTLKVMPYPWTSSS